MCKRRIPGGHLRKLSNMRFLVHEHYEPDTPEYKTFVDKHNGMGTNAYWPHFSFRPSMLKCSMLEKVGPFIKNFQLQQNPNFIIHNIA